MKRLLLAISILVIFVQGCSQVPELILWNKGSSDVEIVFGKTLILLKSNSKEVIPNAPGVDSRLDTYSVILARDGKQYGYAVDWDTLFNSKARRGFGRYVKYYVLLARDGKIYLCNHNSDVPLETQPPGFPIQPKLLE